MPYNPKELMKKILAGSEYRLKGSVKGRVRVAGRDGAIVNFTAADFGVQSLSDKIALSGEQFERFRARIFGILNAGGDEISNRITTDLTPKKRYRGAADMAQRVYRGSDRAEGLNLKTRADYLNESDHADELALNLEARGAATSRYDSGWITQEYAASWSDDRASGEEDRAFLGEDAADFNNRGGDILDAEQLNFNGRGEDIFAANDAARAKFGAAQLGRAAKFNGTQAHIDAAWTELYCVAEMDEAEDFAPGGAQNFALRRSAQNSADMSSGLAQSFEQNSKEGAFAQPQVALGSCGAAPELSMNGMQSKQNFNGAQEGSEQDFFDDEPMPVPRIKISQIPLRDQNFASKIKAPQVISSGENGEKTIEPCVQNRLFKEEEGKCLFGAAHEKNGSNFSEGEHFAEFRRAGSKLAEQERENLQSENTEFDDSRGSLNLQSEILPPRPADRQHADRSCKNSAHTKQALNLPPAAGMPGLSPVRQIARLPKRAEAPDAAKIAGFRPRLFGIAHKIKISFLKKSASEPGEGVLARVRIPLLMENFGLNDILSSKSNYQMAKKMVRTIADLYIAKDLRGVHIDVPVRLEMGFKSGISDVSNHAFIFKLVEDSLVNNGVIDDDNADIVREIKLFKQDVFDGVLVSIVRSE